MHTIKVFWYGVMAWEHGAMHVANQSLHHTALHVAQRLLELLGEVFTDRDLAADISDMRMSRLPTCKSSWSPCAEPLSHVGSHERPEPAVLHLLA